MDSVVTITILQIINGCLLNELRPEVLNPGFLHSVVLRPSVL